MTTKIVTIFKYITILSILIFGIVSCETSFENVGGDLVDNGVFDTKKQTFEVLSYTKNIEKSQVDNISGGTTAMPLGVMENQDFGIFKSDVIAQIIPPATVDWGDNAILDDVYLEIPYDATSIRETTDTKPKFELNNVYGDKNVEYQIKISRLETYLNRLDPYDPSKLNKYYSDKIYDKSTVLYQQDDFKPNVNDTVLYVERTLLSDAFNFEEIQVNDTIKIAEDKPFLRFKLDKTFFENNFMNQDVSYFENRDDFINQFKGIVIEANPITNDGSVMMLDFSKAVVNLYYTNLDQTTDDETPPTDLNNDGDTTDAGEEGIDLNGDGDFTDTEVTHPIRNKQKASFPLVGIKTNHFERDYSGALGNTQITSPNTTEGEQKLYVQGAAGSVAVIDLFNGVDLTSLRNKNWLINEANLIFNIDNQHDNDVPNRLLLYKINPDDNTQILDAITEPDYFNGFLQIDNDKNPTKYKVNITDYISEVLKKEDFIAPSKLGLKVYNAFDKPLTVNDTIIKDFSWNPKGVVLYGNKYNELDADYSKRVKLEIYYTELKN